MTFRPRHPAARAYSGMGGLVIELGFAPPLFQELAELAGGREDLLVVAKDSASVASCGDAEVHSFLVVGSALKEEVQAERAREEEREARARAARGGRSEPAAAVSL